MVKIVRYRDSGISRGRGSIFSALHLRGYRLLWNPSKTDVSIRSRILKAKQCRGFDIVFYPALSRGVNTYFVWGMKL